MLKRAHLRVICAAPHLLNIIQNIFAPISKLPIPIQAVGVHSEIQIIDQLCGSRQGGRGVMPDQSHFHGTPIGGDTPLVALTAASNRREWRPVHYLHMQ